MQDTERMEPMQTEDGDEEATEAALIQGEIDDLEQGSLIEAETVSADEEVL
jgi:hypothetical protein